MSRAIFAFDLLPGFPIRCPSTLKAALEAMSFMGERCPGRLDAAVALDCSGPVRLDAHAMGRLLAGSGFPLVPVSDCMGSAALFFGLDDEDAYSHAWSALERQALEQSLAQPCQAGAPARL